MSSPQAPNGHRCHHRFEVCGRWGFEATGVVTSSPQRGQVSFAEDGDPESWWEGTVFQRKGDFFVITFPDTGSIESREVLSNTKCLESRFAKVNSRTNSSTNPFI